MSVFFFFKQKTAYEMRISDWSSDVCQQEQADDQRPAHAIKRVDQGCHAGIRESCEPSRNTVWQHAAGSPAGTVQRRSPASRAMRWASARMPRKIGRAHV